MCRMVGISKFSYLKHSSIIEEFIYLSKNGKTLPGDPPGHEDGWGIGYYYNGSAKTVKSSNSALLDKAKILSTIKSIENSPTLIFHLRKSAWKDTTSVVNSHPFIDNNIILAHNGTIRDYKKLIPLIHNSSKLLESSLDSEIFLKFINSTQELSLESSFVKAVRYINKNNIYSSLNCVFSDGIDLYGFREYSQNPEYYTLFRAVAERSIIISSEMITGIKNWEEIKPGELSINQRELSIL